MSDLGRLTPEIVGEWLNSYPWDMWATFTFRYNVKDTINAKKYFKRFVADVFFKQGRNISYFAGVEYHKNGGTHIHALLGRTSGCRYKDIGQLWFKRYGYAYVEQYRPALGARYYLTKYIAKDLSDYDINMPLDTLH